MATRRKPTPIDGKSKAENSAIIYTARLGFVGVIFGGVCGFGGTYYVVNKDREVQNITFHSKLVEISAGILKDDPHLKPWAIANLERYSGTSFTTEAKSQLKTNTEEGPKKDIPRFGYDGSYDYSFDTGYSDTKYMDYYYADPGYTDYTHATQKQKQLRDKLEKAIADYNAEIAKLRMKEN